MSRPGIKQDFILSSVLQNAVKIVMKKKIIKIIKALPISLLAALSFKSF